MLCKPSPRFKSIIDLQFTSLGMYATGEAKSETRYLLARWKNHWLYFLFYSLASPKIPQIWDKIFHKFKHFPVHISDHWSVLQASVQCCEGHPKFTSYSLYLLSWITGDLLCSLHHSSPLLKCLFLKLPVLYLFFWWPRSWGSELEDQFS